MNMHTATVLDHIPLVNDTVTVISRCGKAVRGPLIRTYNGTRPGRIRGSVRTGPGKDDFATGFIGIYTDE